MKKISIMLLIFLLLITNFVVISFSEETSTETTVNTENENTYSDEEGIVSNNEIVTNANGKVIEASERREVVTGTVTDLVQDITVEIIDGDYIGEEFKTVYTLSYDIDGKILAYELEENDKVTVQITEDSEGNVSATVMDIVRADKILVLFILFLLLVMIVGGKKGIKAILGLLFTIVLIYLILIKRLFAGAPAISTSIITVICIIVGTFIIIGGGINKKILTAALGTIGGVLSAGIIALIFTRISKMTGACEDAILLSVNMASISFNFRDMLFAGIIISALGACMDVGMSIASSLDEIKFQNPEITWKELFKSGMNIGRDVIGTMTNTLILAYVGSSLTLILLFMASDFSLIDILNKEMIAEQIIPALAGSMGVVFTVPITALIYSVLNKDKVIYKKTSDNKINGKRSLKI